MSDVDVSVLIDEVDPFDLSASCAERGTNAGPETWRNALDAANRNALDVPDDAGARQFFAEFGAWDDEETQGWSKAELDALILQMASGDLRELQSLAPGKGLAGVNWKAASKLSEQGTVSGRLYAGAGKLWFSMG